MYLTYEEYRTYSDEIQDETIFNKIERKQEQNIDILTFNRIKDFTKLSTFNQTIIKECLVDMCDFYYTNKDYVESYLSSYSINGVSIDFNNKSSNIATINGVVIQKNTYNNLLRSNLSHYCLL